LTMTIDKSPLKFKHVYQNSNSIIKRWMTDRMQTFVWYWTQDQN
jgi:hypothetical protein